MSPYPVKDVLSGWDLAPDPDPPAAAFSQAVMFATLVDEVTARPPAPVVQASTTVAGLIPRATSGGAVGLAGQPITKYTATSAAGAALDLTLAAPGYLPLTLT